MPVKKLGTKNVKGGGGPAGRESQTLPKGGNATSSLRQRETLRRLSGKDGGDSRNEERLYLPEDAALQKASKKKES